MMSVSRPVTVFVALLAMLSAVLLTGCSRPDRLGGSSSDDGTTSVKVGQVTVGYPNGWVVLAAGDRPTGWDWAAQNAAGDAGSTQLAVDGDYSALDVDFATASLLGAAQVGSYPGFTLQERKAVSVSGAENAVQVDFTYRTGTTDYEAVWVVARAEGSRTAVIQLSGRAPLDTELVRVTIDDLEVR